MNLSTNGVSNKDPVVISPNKAITLNPNAAEFIPSALRSAPGNVKNADPTRLGVPGPSGKAFQDLSPSSASNNSDDEAHKYWSDQLPDDITPDFKVVAQDELQTDKHVSFASLSLNDGVEVSRFPASHNSQLIGPGHDVFIRGSRDILNMTGSTGYSGTASAGYGLSPPLMSLSNKRDSQFIHGDQFTQGGEGRNHHVESKEFYPKGHLSAKHLMWKEYLASLFPAFRSETIADAYYANGRDLKSTIKILTQLELRHVKSAQNLSLKPLAPPRLSMLDFPPSSLEIHDREDSDHWRYARNGSTDLSDYGNGKSFLADKFQSSGASQSPRWLGTGETLVHEYPDSMEEAHDFTRLQNLFFEQPRQSYLGDNGALVKEASMKGNLHSIQRRAVNGKGRETINQQRNLVVPENRGYIRGQNPLIDLHDLHWGEAIHLVKHELSILRNMSKSARQQLQVMICVGTAHHTRCCRTPTLMPLIEYYLQEEGLQYSRPQPDLLRVLI